MGCSGGGKDVHVPVSTLVWDLKLGYWLVLNLSTEFGDDSGHSKGKVSLLGMSLVCRNCCYGKW